MRKPKPPKPGHFSGDDDSSLHQMLRVDHAGEMAAVEIYKAQMKVFANSANNGEIVKTLAEQEQDEILHKSEFDRILIERKIRPTLLEPIWKPLAQFLGYSTALMGEKAAHACTAAVETVIEGHYLDQEENLKTDKSGLLETIQKFRAEEVAHKNYAIAKGAHDAPAFPLLDSIIQTGCKAAIKISHKI